MTHPVRMKEPSLAPIYASHYPLLCEVARENGYALAIHGTLGKDLDLIAIPWVENAVSAEELVEAVASASGGFIIKSTHLNTDSKPHGRRVWTITLWSEAYIDFGVMPRSCDRDGSLKESLR